MKLNEFLKKKIKTGQDGEFSSAEGKNGKVMIVTVGDKRYVIQASIENFNRFEKWIGKKALVDIKKTGKYHKTKNYGTIPSVKIRTNVEIEDKQSTTNPEEDEEKMTF